MGVKKGQINNPLGRPRGSKNKATADLRKSVLELLDNNWGNVQKDIKSLTPKDRLLFLEKLMSYALPKLQSMEIGADISTRIEGLTEMQLERLIDQILVEGE